MSRLLSTTTRRGGFRYGVYAPLSLLLLLPVFLLTAVSLSSTSVTAHGLGTVDAGLDGSDASETAHVCVHDKLLKHDPAPALAAATTEYVHGDAAARTASTVDLSSSTESTPVASSAENEDASYTSSPTSPASLSSSSAISGNEEPPVWASLRIAVFTDDLNNSEQYCTAAGQQRSDYLGRRLTCTYADVLTDYKRQVLLSTLVPRAVRLHEERLLVRPLARIALRYPFSTSDSTACAQFQIPAGHFGTGVSNADFVLYLAAAPVAPAEGTMAWARTCQVDAQTGRPVAGVLNVSPRYVTNTSAMTRVLAHEMLHALGFDTNVFTQRKMISRAALRGKLNVVGVNSAATLDAARSHYACPSARIMELEDDSMPAVVSSHWKMRNAKGELMSTHVGAGAYSAITIAAMQDTGFYKGNFEKAEPLSWGASSGCTLLTAKCLVGGVVQAPRRLAGAEMFCASVTGNDACTSDRLSIGACDVQNFTQPFAFYAQYFDWAYTGGSLGAMDYCPFIKAMDNALSCNTGSLAAMPGSVVSQAARCLSVPENSSGVVLHGYYDYTPEEVPMMRHAMCVDIRCSSSASTYQVRVRGAAHFVDCPAGQTIQPSVSNPHRFGSGALVCPPYDEVCVGNVEGTVTYGADHADSCRLSWPSSLQVELVTAALLMMVLAVNGLPFGL